MNSSLYMIVDLIFRLATLLFLVRFLLQACAADFYNPISQAIVKGSDGSPRRCVGCCPRPVVLT